MRYPSSRQVRFARQGLEAPGRSGKLQTLTNMAGDDSGEGRRRRPTPVLRRGVNGPLGFERPFPSMRPTAPPARPTQLDADEDEATLQQQDVKPPLPERDKGTLTVIAGPAAGAVFSIDLDRMVIGRGPEADIRIEDRALSRQHASVLKQSGAATGKPVVQFAISDLGSTNGTFVEGVKVRDVHRLHDGARVQVGFHTILRFALQDPAEREVAQRLYESAVRDRVTGVYNRRHFDERIAEEVAYTARHDYPLALMLIDVDHFKSVNDRYGHGAGDAVLRGVAEALVHCVRTEDLVARFGGDEFAILARNTDAPAVQRIADRVIAAVRALRVSQHTDIKVTVSVGATISNAAAAAHGTAGVVAIADKALYSAKSAGRDTFRLGE